MNSDCFVFVEERDEFRMWQGLVGPYYTPAVDSLGNLSWTNNGNLVNPPTVNVSGRGLTIIGIVDTTGDLPASAPQYTCYLVGTTSPYHAYIWDGTTWTDLGIVGKGDNGFSPTVTVSSITGGHQVAITDADGTNTFNVMDGAPGPGVPSGGSTGQVLKKKSATDYDTEWSNAGTADALPLAGGTMSGSINMDGNRVQNLPTPSANGDAASKGYTDGIVVVSDTQPTASQNKLWVDTDSTPGGSYQVPTVAEMQAADALSAKADEIGIVITGARPAVAVTAGQYVIVRSSTITSITDGLYTAVNALSPSTDVSAADLMVVNGGGLNNVIKTTEQTHATNSAGNWAIYGLGNNEVINVYCQTGVGYIFLPFKSNGIWYAKAIDWGSNYPNPVANTTITATIMYY